LDGDELGDGIFKSTLKTLLPLKPEERAFALEKSDEFAKVHASAAVQGQTAAPSADEDVDLHFVCFVSKDETLYELDGRNPRPINHGPIAAESNLALEAAKVVRKIMALTPELNNFTILAYAGLPECSE
jgi:ubiquitin carboxyl-terminal hydrolase L3